MKKAKAYMVRVSKDYPKRLIMEADTPYQAYTALKTKYSVAKNHQDFTKLDKEWNEFKVKDTSTNPDKIFATLDEHSKKLKEFSPVYEKDALQILSKLEVAMPEGYKHIFTLLNTNEEHKKGPDIQLMTAKRMIKSHYESSFATEKGADREGVSMMCMLVGNDQDMRYRAGDGSPKTKYHCEHCNTAGHTAYKYGK